MTRDLEPLLRRLAACGDLVKGQQGIFKHLGGQGRGCEGGHRSGSDCSQCSHRHPSRTMQDPHRRQNTDPDGVGVLQGHLVGLGLGSNSRLNDRYFL